MGCNSSRQEDIRVDRERQRRQRVSERRAQPSAAQSAQHANHTHPATDVPRTSAQSINDTHANTNTSATAATAAADDSSAIYGSSYTNRRAKEFDILHDIIKQTRSHFIDVSAKPQLIEEDELTERSAIYSKQFHDIYSSVNNHHRTPTPSQSQSVSHGANAESIVPSSAVSTIASITALLSSSHALSDTDSSVIVTASKRVSDAIAGVSLQDVGPIVLTFEQLIERGSSDIMPIKDASDDA